MCESVHLALKQRLSENRLNGTLSLVVGQVSISCEIRQVSTIGVVLKTLCFQLPKRVSRDSDYVDKVSSVLSSRLSYLEESIGLIEKDVDSQAALLRSKEPRIVGTARTFYEMVVSTDEITITRQRYCREERRREAVEFAMLHDTL